MNANTIDEINKSIKDIQLYICLFEILKLGINKGSRKRITIESQGYIEIEPTIKSAWKKVNDSCDNLNHLAFNSRDASNIKFLTNQVQLYIDITYQLSSDLYSFDRNNDLYRVNVLTFNHLGASMISLIGALESLLDEINDVAKNYDDVGIASLKRKEK